MCDALYIGSDIPLPIMEWDREDPQFCVYALQNHDEVVGRHFSKPYVYFVGSHEGCSCAFFSIEDSEEFVDDEEDARELEASKDSLRRLYYYILEALRDTDEVELFVSQEDKQAEITPTRRLTMSPEELCERRLPAGELQEGDFVLIRRAVF